ncbi:MAG TPA: ATP-binding protein [Blastocatellia bacterium]|nr:ATP-binding protein [Blastocatellia bacterium]
MAITATAGKQLTQDARFDTGEEQARVAGLPHLGVRGRQIALITALVALIVIVATIINIATLTAVIISRTQKEATQIYGQIDYAVKQELAHGDSNPYAAIASDHSHVRALMDSTLVSSPSIAYVYMTNVSGQIITDERGRNQVAANQYLIGDLSQERPDIEKLGDESAYVQLARVFFGPSAYEFQRDIPANQKPAAGQANPVAAAGDETAFSGRLHIGISAAALRKELRSPIKNNLIIGLLAILGAAVVAISSANLLLRPLKAIATGIDRIGREGEADPIQQAALPKDDVLTGVTSRLKQLSERLAGERSELELMRGRLRQVISHLEERLLLINREGRVILASPDAEQILGLHDAELTGLPIDESLGANHPLVETVERAFSERKSVARTTLHIPDGARTRQLLTSVQYIEDAGEPVGALISMRDYESFQKYESQWDLSKKLAELGRITSGIAHEVKNPLNAMVIHLEILRSKIENGAADPKPQLEILDSEIKRLDRVVQTFLTFTRPVEIKMEPVDVNTIVHQVVVLAGMEAAERGVTINREMASGSLIVNGDADLLKQALLNVIQNGAQAMPEGGPLKVRTWRGSDGSACITVSDRGVGISAEARDRIFNLYYTTKKGGTGIGLAQAFRAVQLHNGTIRFTSEVGVGTTFEIILPAMN